jgi:NADPH:quinone reductase-like Zn-dependent oxidoreductase
MKTVRIHQYGGVDVLQFEEIPVPTIASDEVLIKIHATSINPLDWKVREGFMKETNLHRLPLTLGWDCSGTIEKTGNMVRDFKMGDDVYCRPPTERDGSYAEFIAVKASEVALKPKTISYVEAASIPLAGIAAWETLINKANIRAGQRVLILRASGGVGSLAIQIAKARGCYVIGTTSGVNINFVKSLGADEVYDYEKQDFSEHLSNIDVVLDTIGGTIQEKAFKVLRKGGMMVSIISKPSFELANKFGVRAEYVSLGPSAPILNELRVLIDKGKMKPVVDKVYKFEEVKEAQMYSQSGKARGKIVLKVA